jgi:hypothetical protein
MNQQIFQNANPLDLINNAKVSEGIILIPDIGGYTRFVHNTDMITGSHITYELLSSIIEQNILDLKMSEIEGDAILFYKYGIPPTIGKILDQYKAMTYGFNKKKEELKNRYGLAGDLSLKLIAHYGPLTEFNIGGFRKLYGEAVIEAHRLLKNSIESRSYALVTNDLMRASCFEQPKDVDNRVIAGQLCEAYDQLDSICYTYFDFSMEERERLTA